MSPHGNHGSRFLKNVPVLYNFALNTWNKYSQFSSISNIFFLYSYYVVFVLKVIKNISSVSKRKLKILEYGLPEYLNDFFMIVAFCDWLEWYLLMIDVVIHFQIWKVRDATPRYVSALRKDL